MIPPKDPDNSPELDPKLKTITEMTDAELKIMTIRKLNEIQNTDSQIKETRKSKSELS